ncbi:ABC transporter permease [Bowdeniella nasicola]|uniref:ABC transporter permease n=1 Tax=Bowdeniella nasicola TaxID=208480 RepID=UPI000AD71B76|nr:iron ABC transporter permease [Bowdeniella nasicola]
MAERRYRVVLAVAAGLPLVFLALFFAWPAATLVARGFTSEAGSWDLSAFQEVSARPRTWRIIGLTLGMATAGTAVSVLLGIPGAYALYRCRFPGYLLARAIVAVPFVLPTVVVGVAFRSLLAPGGWLDFLQLDGTVTAVVAAMVFFNYSLVVRNVGMLWARLDPRQVQAARALGATPLRAFATVTLPSLMPAIASAASVVFLFCATAFGIVLILGGVELATIESEIYLLTTTFLDLRAAAVLSIVQLVVIAVSLAVAGQARKRSERALNLRPDPFAHTPGRADVPALAITAVVIVGLIVMPVAQLLWRSLHRAGEFTLANYRDLADAGATRAVRVSAVQAAGTSILVALLAAAIALVVGVAVALVVTRRPRTRARRRALAILDATFMLPLGVSAVTVGFGFLITMNRPPLDLRSSFWLVPLAQAVVAVPLVVRILSPVLRAISPRQREVAATLGASPLRVLATIDGAHLLRAGGVAAGFALAVSLGEFGATSFLARPESPTLPVVIYRLISRPGAVDQGMAMAASVVLAALAATIMVLVERTRPAQAGGFA